MLATIIGNLTNLSNAEVSCLSTPFSLVSFAVSF